MPSAGRSGKNVITFVVDNSSSVHADNRQKGIFIFDKSSGDGLDDTTITTEKTRKKFCLSLHYNRSNSLLFVNGLKTCQLQAKESEVNAYPLCLRNILQDFAVDRMKKLDYMNMYIISQLILAVLVLKTSFLLSFFIWSWTFYQ